MTNKLREALEELLKTSMDMVGAPLASQQAADASEKYFQAREKAQAALNEDTSKPVAWTIPGDENADMNGFIPVRIHEGDEFTKPLYDSPQVHWKEKFEKEQRACNHWFQEANKSHNEACKIADEFREFKEKHQPPQVSAEDYQQLLHYVNNVLTDNQLDWKQPDGSTIRNWLKARLSGK